MELKNKVVVITGGTKGLGRELAFSFLNNEAKVVVCSRNIDEIKEINNEGILGVVADVTKEDEMNNLLLVAKEKFGQVDIWVNNAGIWLPHLPVEEVDWKRAHDLIEVNLFGTIYGSKAALSQMRKQDSGMIINILSTSALEGKINETAYCASKFAAKGFTESLRKEVEKENIKIISIYPGGTKTNLFDEKKPENYSIYMDPKYVIGLIVENLKKDNPDEELIIRRNN